MSPPAFESAFPSSSEKLFTVIVTGANGGIGYSTCAKLIEENIKSTANTRLLLIPTCRGPAKGLETKQRLEAHASRFAAKHARSLCTGGQCPILVDPVASAKIQVRPGSVDLTSLPSIRAFVAELRGPLGATHVDSLVLNAGYGGWSGVDWLRCFYEMLFVDWVSAVTYPTFKIAHVGEVTRPQVPGRPEGVLGKVFCANVFGHYLLAHYLAPELSRAFSGFGRAIWVSSLESYRSTLDFGDFQGLASPAPYESSKRLTDVLALSSDLPETQPYVRRWIGGGGGGGGPTKPASYVCHPGICGTSIFPLIFPLPYLMLFGFWVARLLGGPWQTLFPDSGANAPAWLASADPAWLAQSEESGTMLLPEEGAKLPKESPPPPLAGAKCKWGSATDRAGRPRILPTEVEGWAIRGVPGERSEVERARRPGQGVQGQKEIEEFKKEATQCWRQMEELREEWEARLDKASL